MKSIYLIFLLSLLGCSFFLHAVQTPVPALPQQPILGAPVAAPVQPVAVVPSMQPQAVALVPQIQVVGPVLQQPFSLVSSLTLVNAQKELPLGSSVPLTGGVSILGKDVTYGLNLIFTKINRAGGIAGAQIKLNSMDDRYQAPLAKENISKLIKTSPFLIGCFGTEANLAILPQLEEQKIASFFPVAGLNNLRDEKLCSLINYRASIAREVEALVEYTINREYKRKVAIFYEENRWGESGAKAAEVALAKYGIKPVIKSSYLENTVNVGAAVSEITKARPSAIICISHIRPSYIFIQQVVNAGMQNVLFLGISDLAPMQQLIKKSRGVALVCASVVPDPYLSKLPIVEQYRADMKSFLPNVEISPFSLEGYICASLFVEALKKAPAPQTLMGIMQQFEAMKSYNFNGLPLDFDPKTRQLSSKVWVNDATGKEWIAMLE